MSPEERKVAGAGAERPARPHRRRDRGAARAARRTRRWKRGSRARRIDVTLPARPEPAGTRASDHPGLGGGHRDLRRHGLLRRRRAAYRDRLVQFRRAQHPARASGAAGARHLLLERRSPARTDGAADAHLAGADPHHGDDAAADPHHRARAHLPLRFRPDAHADVPPGRGAGHRRDAPISAT